MQDKKAQTKRTRISKAQRMTLLEVLIASVVLGACIVLAQFLLKYIKFNAKVISAKDTAIAAYDQTIRNVGACVDKDKNGRLSDDELKSCDPNTLSVNDVKGSLRYNVYEEMAENESLELVARQRNENGMCYDESNKIINYSEKYEKATTREEREQALQGVRVCSALRVISDALPDNKNTEALMASLNDVFLVANIEPESIAPRDETAESGVQGVEVIPVSFRMNGSGADVVRLLDDIERSIRIFDVTSGTFQWTANGISARADASAYYLGEINDLETTKVVKAKVRK